MQNTDELKILMENIIKLRKYYGYTKLQMARLLGISPCTLSKIEAREFPPRLSMKIIGSIHRHFGILPKNMFSKWE